MFFDNQIDFSVTIFSWFIVSDGQCCTSCISLRASSRSNDEISICSISVRFTETKTTNFVQSRSNLWIRTTIQTAKVFERSWTRESRKFTSVNANTSKDKHKYFCVCFSLFEKKTLNFFFRSSFQGKDLVSESSIQNEKTSERKRKNWCQAV